MIASNDTSRGRQVTEKIDDWLTGKRVCAKCELLAQLMSHCRSSARKWKLAKLKLGTNFTNCYMHCVIRILRLNVCIQQRRGLLGYTNTQPMIVNVSFNPI